MPYKERGKWRAKVYFQGKPYTKRCKTKKEALVWENKKRKELEKNQSQRNTISLRDASAKYLEYCELQFDYSTFVDKKKALKELGQKTGNITLDQVEPATILHKVLIPQKTKDTFSVIHSFI